MQIRALSLLLCPLVLLLTVACPARAAQNKLSKREKTEGWKLLFDGKTTEGWRGYRQTAFPAHGWEVKKGWLHCFGQKGGDVITDATFDQFDLEWDWKLAPVGNSGVKYFVPETHSSAVAHEYQMLDDDQNPDGKLAEGKRVTASFYDVLKPDVKPPTRPMGKINHSRILVKGNHVEHWLNGVKVLEYECNSDAIKSSIARSKFKNVEHFAECLKGHILLQDHESEVWFRNIKIHDLSGT